MFFRSKSLFGKIVVLFLAATNLAGSQVLAPDAISAQLIVTDRSRELFERWRTGNMAGYKIESLEFVPRNRFIAGIVMFKNCQPDQNGNCQAKVDYTLYDPNGEVYGEINNGELWKGKAAPRSNYSQLAVAYLGIVIEPQDPPGEYRLEATVYDNVSGNEVALHRYFQVPE